LFHNNDADEDYNDDDVSLEDQFNPIHSVQWSPDGYLLSANDDKNIRKWTDQKESPLLLLLSNSLSSFSTSLSVNSKSITSKVSVLNVSFFSSLFFLKRFCFDIKYYIKIDG